MIEAPQRTERLLEKSGRITPREVLEAYKQTGLKPQRAVFMDKDSACAIGALMAHEGAWVDNDEWARYVKIWDTERMGPYVGTTYRRGFTMGFDGVPRPAEPEDDHPLVQGDYAWEMLGYRDGKRVRAFVLNRYPELSSHLEG